MDAELAKKYFLAGLDALLAERYAESETFFRKSLEIVPDRESTLTNLTAALLKLERFEEAEALASELTQRHPLNHQAWVNRGVASYELGRVQEAIAAYEKALELDPDYAEAWLSKGTALHQLRRYAEALASYEKAAQINPDYAEAWFNRGITLNEMMRHDEAIASYDAALQIKPDYHVAWLNRGAALNSTKLYDQALASYDQAIRLKPNYAKGWVNRGVSLVAMGDLRPGQASYREAIRIDPDYLEARSNLLFSLNYCGDLRPAEMLAEATQYGARVSGKCAPKFSDWDRNLHNGRLKIGFVSGDLSNHPVGFFLEGLLRQIDRHAFEVYAFPTHAHADDLTARIKPLFDAWIPIDEKSDRDAAVLIRENGIHVLIDLSGHTAYNRLPVFSYRPARVQATWLGYFATTGLPEMDYFLGDPWMSPSSEQEHFTEKIWNLSETWLCLEPPNLPCPIGKLPALSNGFLTFGNFGNLSKVNDKVVQTWAALLSQVSDARLFLKSNQLASQGLVDTIRQRFAEHNITADRLILEGPGPRQSYFEAYGRVDIVLDTFPYPGGTTSFDALWMGVPVLTLKGDRFLSRLGEAINIKAGHPEWIAQDVEDYMHKAIAFAADRDRLAHLRGALRERVLESCLFDTPRFARSFGDAVQGMWLQKTKPE